MIKEIGSGSLKKYLNFGFQWISIQGDSHIKLKQFLIINSTHGPCLSKQSRYSKLPFLNSICAVSVFDI